MGPGRAHAVMLGCPAREAAILLRQGQATVLPRVSRRAASKHPKRRPTVASPCSQLSPYEYLEAGTKCDCGWEPAGSQLPRSPARQSRGDDKPARFTRNGVADELRSIPSPSAGWLPMYEYVLERSRTTRTYPYEYQSHELPSTQPAVCPSHWARAVPGQMRCDSREFRLGESARRHQAKAPFAAMPRFHDMQAMRYQQQQISVAVRCFNRTAARGLRRTDSKALPLVCLLCKVLMGHTITTTPLVRLVTRVESRGTRMRPVTASRSQEANEH